MNLRLALPFLLFFITGLVDTGLSARNIDFAFDRDTILLFDSQNHIETVDFTIAVTHPNSISLDPVITEVSCNGQSDGAVQLTTTGDAPPFTYLWDNGATTEDLTQLAAGTYCVIVSDANGFQETACYTVSEPTAIQLTIDQLLPPSCFGTADGSLSITATGGTGAYDYFWSHDPFLDAPVANDIPAGNYSVNVVDERNCSQLISNLAVGQPDSITVDFSLVDVSCIGGSDGRATAMATGGTGPYTYEWENGPAGPEYDQLSVGDYPVRILDFNNCPAIDTARISEPATAVSGTAVQTVFGCSGSDQNGATATGQGGSGTYTYAWDNGANSATAENLSPGEHFVTITDGAGCSAVVSILIGSLDPIALTATLSPPRCNGEANGNLSLATVTGGAGDYTFTWSTGATTADISGLAAGTYCVTVIDVAGCTLDTCLLLRDPEPLQFALDTIAAASCFGVADGSITLAAEGGTGSLTFDWSHDPALNAPTATALPAGTYSVAVSDDNGCSAALSGLVVSQPDSLLLSFTATPVTCFGGDDGSASAQADGGSPPYDFSWENGPDTPDLTQLVAGTYRLSVTDARGCVSVDSIRISQPATPVTGSAEQTRQGCFGANENEALVIAQGGDGNYSYLWDNGATTPLATGLPPGFHAVTITDGVGCPATVLVEVIDLTPVTTTAERVDPVCNGADDGRIVLDPDGGSGLYFYNWDTPATGNAADQLGAGTYCVTITDDVGCVLDTCYTLTEPVAIDLTVASLEPVACFGGTDGRLSLATTGGAGALTYTWDHDSALVGPLATGLGAGLYRVTVRDTTNCTQTLDGIQVTQPDSLALSLTATDVNCRDDSDGTILVQPAGGTGPYGFTWSNGADGPTLSDLPAGDYTVTVSDANGCQTIAGTQVAEPETAISATAQQTLQGCFGASANTAIVTTQGGTPGYTYRWDDGQETAEATGLSAGPHTVIVMDAAGCTTMVSLFLSDLSPLVVAATLTDPTCSADSDGGIQLASSGSSGPYTYLWDDQSSAATLDQRTAGTYCVTVTDARGCARDTCLTLQEPAPVQVDLVDSNPTRCFGGNTGSLVVTATGGTGTLSYRWNDELSQIADTAVFLSAGLYTVTVRDSRGCSRSLSDLEVTQPDSLQLAFTPRDVSCREGSDGSALAIASGGSPDYNFVWDTGQTGATLTNRTAGRYSVTVTDSQGCQTIDSTRIGQPMTFVTPMAVQTDRGCFGDAGNRALASAEGGVPGYTYRWENEQTTAEATGLSAGIHLVTITDAAGCGVVGEVELFDLDPITFTLIADAPSCNGDADGAMGITQLAGGNGTAESDYTFTWSNGDTGIVTTGLSGGQTYRATVTDAKGCSGMRQRELPNPPSVNFALLPRPVSCFGGSDGSISLIDVEGPNSGAYQVSWSTGAGGVLDTLLTGLSAADYTATVTDVLGCEAVRTATVPQPLSLSVSISKTEIDCFQGREGSVELQVSGGVPDYQVAWTDGASGIRRTGLGAGSYTFEITDANGCTLAGTTTLQQPSEVAIVAETEDVTCTGDPSGRIQLSTTGGVPPYQYSLDNETFNGTGTFLGIFAGTYPVYVRDAAGCAYQLQVTVEEPDAISVDLGPDLDLFFGDSLQLTAAITNAAGVVSYFWRGGYQGTLSCDNCATPTVNPEFTIDYFLTVIDENGCMAEDQLRVNVRKERVLEVPTAFTPNGDGSNDRLRVHGLPLTRVDVFRVYDRWGEMLFEDVDFPVNAPDRGWDGTFRNQPMPAGVYLWQAIAIFPDDSEAIYSGQTTLIR